MVNPSGLKAGLRPKNAEATVAPMTEERITGIALNNPIPLYRISSPKRAPPRGALKVPAMPAANPQTTRSLMLRASSLNNWPMIDPSVAPI